MGREPGLRALAAGLFAAGVVIGGLLAGSNGGGSASAALAGTTALPVAADGDGAPASAAAAGTAEPNSPLLAAGSGGATPGTADPRSYPVAADAFVSPRSTTRNYGGEPTLRVGGPSQTRSYLRFVLAQPYERGGPAVRLRLFATIGARSGLAVRLSRSEPWSERAITAATAPRLGATVARRGAIGAGRWVTIDITRAIAGRRIVDLALVRRGPGTLRFLSREAGSAQGPRLVLGDVPEPDPVVAAAGDIACDPNSPNLRDTVPGTCLDRQTSDLLVTRPIESVLTLGDHQYERDTLSAFLQGYDRTWGRVKAITRPVVGNHEYLTPDAKGYFDYFNGPGRAQGRAGRRGEGWYSFDVGTWHLVALNSMCDEVGGCAPGSPQFEWLKADLAAHPAQCTLAYWHHPRFSSGVPGSNDRTDAFWRLLYEAGADLVLGGHSHDYERFAPQTPDAAPDDARGIREFVAGTGGKNNYPFGLIAANSEVRDALTSGVLLLTLRPGGYDWQFEPVPGRLLRDAGSGVCH